jgi:mannose-6-phosphate isomerase-like protein (cupin superfamily)
MLVEDIRDLHMQAASHSRGDSAVCFGEAFKGEQFKGQWSHVEYVTVPPGSAIPVHEHQREEEIYFIFSGTGVLTVDGSDHRVGPGILTLCPAGCAHGLRNVGSEEIKLIVVGVHITR